MCIQLSIHILFEKKKKNIASNNPIEKYALNKIEMNEK